MMTGPQDAASPSLTGRSALVRRSRARWPRSTARAGLGHLGRHRTDSRKGHRFGRHTWRQLIQRTRSPPATEPPDSRRVAFREVFVLEAPSLFPLLQITKSAY